MDSHHGILTATEVATAPMGDAHKELVMRHVRRLGRIILEQRDTRVGGYTTRQTAREQLARMTVLVRWYTARQHDLLSQDGKLVGEGDESVSEIESMIADVVDSSFFVRGHVGDESHARSFEGPLLQATVSEILKDCEQEIATLMQDFAAEDADSVTELWQADEPVTHQDVPAAVGIADLGDEVDWNYVLRRSRSEDRILVHRYQKFSIPVGDRTRSTKCLLTSRPHVNDMNWPPKQDFGRQQSQIADEDMHIEQPTRSRAVSEVGSVNSLWSWEQEVLG